MVDYQTKKEIEVDFFILTACKIKRRSISSLKYDSGLCIPSLERRLEFLIEQGKLRKEKNTHGHTVYSTTQVGSNYLEECRKSLSCEEP